MEFVPPSDLYRELLKTLSSAREDVILVSPWVEGNLAFELISAIPQGVKVELVIRAGSVEDLKITPAKVLKVVKAKGGKVLLHPSLHAKFILIDRKTAFVGSANLTDKGLNLLNNGNREAVLKITDKKTIGELLEYYQTLKGESLEISPDLVGFLIDKTETGNFKALLFEELPEGSFLLVEGGIFSLLEKVENLNTNLLREKLFEKVPPLEFKEDYTLWGKAFLFALFQEGVNLSIGELKPLGVLDNGKLLSPKIPPRSGASVFKLNGERIKPLTGRTAYGKPMECPVLVGRWRDVDINLDLGEVYTRHVSVLGITGSGKSYFTQRVLARAANNPCGVSFVVLDPQGEYSEALKPLLGNEFGKVVTTEVFENTLLPLTVEDFSNLLEGLGFSHLLRGSTKEAKLLKDFLAREFLATARGKGKSLEQILEEAKREIPPLGSEIETLKGEISFLYGEGVLKNQPQEVERVLRIPKKGITIFDFSQILDTKTKLNLAGLILKNLFFKRKKGEKTVVVVEEAHNFAPERGFGDAEAGRGNLALLMLEKIAAEGRKLNLGLWIVAQRPAQVNKYILSQTNTHFLFKLLDKNDLQAVETYLSRSSEGLIKRLPLLGIGECIATGLGIPFEVGIEVI